MSLWLALASGLLQGVAFLWPWAQPGVWGGVALLAVALHRAKDWRYALGGLALAALARQVVALHWWVETARHYAGSGPVTSPAVAALGWASTALLSQVPLLAVAASPARRLPLRWWLPGAWAVGELGLEVGSGFSMTQVLHSQWALPPMLRALAYVGWVPLLLLCLYASASAGEAVARGRWSLLAPVGLVLGVLAALPPIPAADEALVGVGVVHVASLAHLPARAPPGTEVLIWPEGTVPGKWRVREGRLSPPVRLSSFRHGLSLPGIAGLTLRTPEGYLNAAAVIDAEGRLVDTRGKSVLVPIGEREMLGLRGHDELFIPGRAPPLLSLASRKVVPLICYEAFSRLTALRGHEAGGGLVVVLASDLPLAGSRFALQQSLGAVILRAVELHVPAVRATLGGVAVVVSSDGRVLARSAPGHSGVLLPPVLPGASAGGPVAFR